MKKIFYSLMLVSLVAGLTPGVFAEETASPSPSASPKSLKEMRREIEEAKNKLKMEVKGKKQEIKEEMKEKKTEFKTELKKVKDDGKRARLVKASEELALLNARALSKFSKSLDQLEKVLEGIKVRIDKKAEKGFDVSKARTAMEEAKTEIAAGRAAIETQKAKIYKIEPASDADAKDALKKARKDLEADLKVVRGAVRKAREVTHRVATTLAKVRKEGRVSPSLSPSVSSSPSPSPSPTASPSPSATP